VDSEARWNDPVSHLRQALAADAFSLYCQPICELAAHMSYPMGEVLVRLREAEKALQAPGDFLPVLEHYGMMPELDRWVVRSVLRRIAGGMRIPRFCVNLSAQTLADRAFPSFFAHELEAAGVEGERILFEIDEADALALPDCTPRFAATVGSLGAGVVIDGFGRTADCITLLNTPCVQFVKMHGSVVRQLVSGQSSAEDAKTLLWAASEMKIEVIAESVEEPEVLLKLKMHRVGFAQGFGIYEPHPIDVFTQAGADGPASIGNIAHAVRMLKQENGDAAAQ
jgi:EAL domain-containing protein (putative c-di-GMP-specific phosphodiesterase class I)